MKDEVFVYECPNCGGKANYDKLNHKWICEYCGNSYEALFHQQENKLPKVIEKEIKVYKHFCTNCNKFFISTNKNESVCTFCNSTSSDEGKEFIITNMIPISIPMDAATADLIYEIGKYRNYLPKEFNKITLKSQYLNCDLYNGCVKVSYNNKKIKFVFVNLLIPNIEYEDYRFMYEIGNIGLKDTKVLNNSSDKILSIAINNGDNFNSTEDKNYKEEIINECINEFKRIYKITSNETVNVENNLKIKDGTFIPIYISEVNYNNKIYRQYRYGTISILKDKGNILEFVEEENSREIAKKSNLVASISKFIAIASFMSSIVVVSFLSPHLNSDILLIIGVILIIVTIIFGATYFNFKKKYNYYLRTIKLTKEEYFNQIINNSNYVKIIKEVK